MSTADNVALCALHILLEVVPYLHTREVYSLWRSGSRILQLRMAPIVQNIVIDEETVSSSILVWPRFIHALPNLKSLVVDLRFAPDIASPSFPAADFASSSIERLSVLFYSENTSAKRHSRDNRRIETAMKPSPMTKIVFDLEKAMPNLKSFKLTLATSQTLEPDWLSLPPTLERLNLQVMPKSAPLLTMALPNLKWQKLSSAFTSFEFFQQCQATLHGLVTYANEGFIGDRRLYPAWTWPNLQSLHFIDNDPPTNLAFLASLPHLTSLKLDSNHLDTCALEHFHQLQTLHLTFYNFNRAPIDFLPPSLTEVELLHTGLTFTKDDLIYVMQRLPSTKKLTTFNYHGRMVGGNSMPAWTSEQLAWLPDSLTCCNIVWQVPWDDALPHIGGVLPKLKEIPRVAQRLPLFSPNLLPTTLTTLPRISDLDDLSNVRRCLRHMTSLVSIPAPIPLIMFLTLPPSTASDSALTATSSESGPATSTTCGESDQQWVLDKMALHDFDDLTWTFRLDLALPCSLEELLLDAEIPWTGDWSHNSPDDPRRKFELLFGPKTAMGQPDYFQSLKSLRIIYFGQSTFTFDRFPASLTELVLTPSPIDLEAVLDRLPAGLLKLDVTTDVLSDDMIARLPRNLIHLDIKVPGRTRENKLFSYSHDGLCDLPPRLQTLELSASPALLRPKMSAKSALSLFPITLWYLNISFPDQGTLFWSTVIRDRLKQRLLAQPK